MTLGREEIENRFGPRTESEKAENTKATIRGAFLTMGETLDKLLPDGRLKSLCMTDLESAENWSLKASDNL